jgi:hypothetical protein
MNSFEEFLILPISIGSFVFLLQNTDFVYEYGSLLCQIFKLKKLDIFLKFEQYRSNSGKFDNYISFLGSVFGAKNNFFGFLARLLSCFICLSCFISLTFNFLFGNALYFLLCFFISSIVYFVLFSIKKKIYS